MADTDPTEPLQNRYRGLVPFKPGESGNPAGRPKGSRNKLGEAFVADLLADWQEHGATVIKEVRTERPADYLKVVASILPKEVNVTVNEYDDLTDDELAERFAAIASQLGYGGGGDSRRASAAPTAGRSVSKPH